MNISYLGNRVLQVGTDLRKESVNRLIEYLFIDSLVLEVGTDSSNETGNLPINRIPVHRFTIFRGRN